MFFGLIDDRAYEFIAKKVSMKNGDIRVAFGLLKAALEKVRDLVNAKVPSVCNQEGNLDYDKVRVNLKTVLEVY